MAARPEAEVEGQAAEAAPGVAEAAAEATKPAPLTSEEAIAQAAAEGLTLEPSSAGTSGYKGVNLQRGLNTYGAYVRRAGKQVHLGSFVTAEEAALAYARTPEAQAQVAAAEAKRASLVAKVALAQAAAEGRKPKPKKSASGSKGVGLPGAIVCAPAPW